MISSSGWSDMPGKSNSSFKRILTDVGSHTELESNSFFKRILTDVGSHTELLFPEMFSRIFGKKLKDSVSLNTPSGSQWSVDLKRHKGKVWLQNGWPEFAEFHSINSFYLLVFEYKGDSSFQVLIFEPSALEIDYPVAGSDRLNFVKSTQAKKRVIKIDDSSSSDDVIEIDDSSSSDDVIEIDDSSSSDDLTRPCKKKTRTKDPITEVSTKLRQEKGKAANKVAKDRSFALANAFKSKNPFFVHVMKESDTIGGGWPNVYIPKKFKAHENWKSNDQVILHVGEESWVVFSLLSPDCNKCRIGRGWTIFARENSLSVGDVCVFELINPSEKVFKVFIYRAAKEPNCVENDKLHEVRSEADKARVLESVKAFRPKNPSFTLEVKNSYLYGNSMTVPKKFIEKHITKDSCTINLQLPDGRFWSVRCYIKGKCAKLSAGWKNFSKENNLAEGDICGFEVVNQRLFNVVIFRVESQEFN